MELVHHDLADVGVLAVAQGDGSQHFGSAADDRGVRVDGRVARQHSDVLRAEELAQVEELLGDQRLDRRGVEGHLVMGESGEVRARRNKALSGAGGGRKDHIRPGNHLDQRLLLSRIERDALAFGP